MAEPAPANLQEAKMLLGRVISKPWPSAAGVEYFEGVVKSVTDDWKDPKTNKRSRELLFTVRYPADGDREDLLWEELSKYLVPLPADALNARRRQEAVREGSSGGEEAGTSSKRPRQAAKVLSEQDMNQARPQPSTTQPGASHKAKTPKTAAKPSQPRSQPQSSRPAATPATQAAPRTITPVVDPDQDDRSAAAKCREIGEPGQLKRIVLQNFMCHEHFALDFGPHVTLVSGSNGSGKSAVMQGLQACLGVSARETGRSKQLAEFITTGADSAVVRVTLWNDGVEAFKSDVYGTEITIERVIRRSGGGYKVYGSEGAGRGRPCSHKKEDVDAVLEYFNINAANPLTVITQDMARTFLNGDAHGKRFKYQMYLEGTMLGEIGSLNKSSCTFLKQSAEILKSHDEQLKKQKHDMGQLEKDLARLKDLERQRTVAGQMEVVAMYQALRDMAAKEVETQGEIEQLQADSAQCETKLQEVQQEKDRVKEDMQEKKAVLARAVDESTRVQAALQELKHQHQQRMMERKAAQHKHQEASNTLKELQTQRQDWEDKMAESSQGRNTDKLEEAKRQLAEFETQMRQRTLEIEGLERQFAQKRDQEMGLRDEAQQMQQRLDAEQRLLGRHQSELSNYTQQLQELRASSTNNAAKFGGRQTVQLLDSIQRSPRMFKRPPLGPVGMYLGLSDQRWSKALEVSIGGNLNRFICFDNQDCKALSQLANQLRMPISSTAVRPGIPRHHVPRRQEQTGLAHPSIMDVLRINHPDPAMADVIFNWLVDTCRIENTLLVDSHEQGRSIVYDRNTAVNAFNVYDVEGSNYKNTSGTVTVNPIGNRNVMPRLGLDTSEMCAQLEAMIATKRQEVEGQQQLVAGVRQRLADTQARARALHDECTQLAIQKNAAKRQLTSFQAQRDSLLPSAGGADDDAFLTVATQAIQDIHMGMCATQVAHQETEAALAAAQQAEQEAKQAIADKKAATQLDYGSLSAEIEGLASREAGLQRRITALQHTIDQVATALQDKQKLLDECNADRLKVQEMTEQLCPEDALVESEKQVRDYFRQKYVESKSRRQGKPGRQGKATQQGPTQPGPTQHTQAEPMQAAEAGPEAAAGDGDGGSGEVNAEQEAWVQQCMTQQVLSKEAARLNQMLDEAERVAGGNEAELEHQLEEARNKYEKRLIVTRAVQERLSVLQRSCNSRLESFDKLQKAVKQVASNSFCRFMARRQHIGQLEVDDDKGELNLRVKVKGKTDPTVKWVDDLKQLSGGERSYTSVSLLLALGQWSESPFRCLDEFDVFMDPVNRRVATEALLQFALDYNTRQYVLLTPQDTEAVMHAYRNLEARIGETLPGAFLKIVTIRPARPQA